MPIDINLIRVDRGGNPDFVKESQRKRFASVELVDKVIEKDNAWRGIITELDNLRKQRNAIQREVGEKKKKKQDCPDLIAQVQAFDPKIKEMEEKEILAKKEVDFFLNQIGNIVDPSVPVDKDENNNGIVKLHGETPSGPEYLHHHELLAMIGGYEPERGVAVAGHRAYFLRDAGVLLNQALINYSIAFLRARGYSILQPPFFMNKDVMAGVAQLEQFDEELYKVTGEDEKYLIATSEQPICGFHKDEWLQKKDLPLRYCGYSTCFRKEAGSHGKDTWGIFRVHQFEKVEQFVLCDSDLETSQKMQEEMISTAEEFYKSLGFSYRVVNIVTGALNNAAIRKYDLEAWFPGYRQYRELVSCSNCTDYQSRSMEIRCGSKQMGQNEKKYVHMLNATLCATTRTICCILENYQTPDGIRVPEVLVPFMGGETFIQFVNKLPASSPSEKKTETNKQEQPKAEKTKQNEEKKELENVPSTATTATSSTQNLSETEIISQNIANLGDEIRQLKSQKASKETLQPKIDQLLALKNQYKQVSGQDYTPPGTSKPATEKPKEEKKTKATPTNNNAPATNKKNEKKTESKEQPTTTPTPTPVPTNKSNKSDNLFDQLNSQLLLTPYIEGFVPSKEDAKVFNMITSNHMQLDRNTHQNLVRWFNHVSSFSATQRSSWN